MSERASDDEKVNLLDEAVALLEGAEALADGLPTMLSGARLNLSRLLIERHEVSPNASELARAEIMLQELRSSDESSLTRRRALDSLGSLLQNRGELAAALDAYRQLLSLLRDAAPAWLDRSDREASVGGFLDVVGRAVEVALTLQREREAVELFEIGSLLLADNELMYAADLDRLEAVTPALYDQLVVHWREADAAVVDGSGDVEDHSRSLADRLAAAKAGESLLRAIREIPGFEEFLVSPPLALETDGQVAIILSLGEDFFDAVQVEGAAVRHVRITSVSAGDVRQQCREFVDSMNRALDYAEPDSIRHERHVSEILSWMWERVMSPLLTELGFHEGQEPLRRIHWCPNGVLRLIPWHAVGRPGDRRGVLFSAVSSYASSLTSLRRKRQGGDIKSPREQGAMVLVAMPESPGPHRLSSLPGALEEALWLGSEYPGSETIGTDGALAATAEHVLPALRRATWAHFACHALSDPMAPHRSVLVLRDVASSPLTAARLSREDLGNLSVSFLAACSTNVSSGVHLNESLSLGRALEQAGCRHVVGTLWPIYDQISFDVVTRFYSEVPMAVTDDSIARALHVAVRRQCETMPDSPTLWAAHVHSGP